MDCPDAQTLADLLLEKLTVSTSKRLRLHVDACANCQEFARRFRELSATHASTRSLKPGSGGTGIADATDETIYPLRGSRAAGSFHLPGYRIAEELGRGGMGVVFRAVQESLNRPVAIKMILAGGLSKPEDLARFMREGKTMAQFSHPNFVQVFEMGTVDLPTGPQPYMILEYADGGNLREWMGSRPLSAQEAAAIVSVLARSLDVAHSQGIVHRDLKPANILLQNEVRTAGPKSNPKLGGPAVTLTRERGPAQRFVPKISDFGLAKQLESGDGLTVTGNIMGTPAYMAPEQYGLSSRSIGPAADIYALGGILFTCLTARPPFGMSASGDTLPSAPTESPPAPSEMRPDLPAALDDIVLRCLERDPAARYATAGDLADELDAFLSGDPDAVKPRPKAKRRVAKSSGGIPRSVLYGVGLFGIVFFSIVLTVLFGGGLRPKNDNGPPGKQAAFSVDDPKPPEKQPKARPTVDPKLQPKASSAGVAKFEPMYLINLQPIATANWPFNPPRKDFPKGGKGPPNGKGPPEGKGPPDGKGPPEGKGPPPEDFNGDIRVDGKLHRKAIFMHPPGFGGFAKITYRVPAGYVGFIAKATMRDDPKGNGSMYSQAAGNMMVFDGKGQVLWEAHGIHSQADARDCRISVVGHSTIILATTCDGDPMGCHLVWLDPRFTKPVP
ncbi:MAG TPA: protein kinase [Gemmataceae bacterium]|jgi:serine/threonine protein kinase|nr:protein kinase [Gemmataceae bacterium]